MDRLSAYPHRFGALPADVVAIIGRTRDAQILLSWTRLAAGGSAEELVAEIRTHAAD